MDRFSTALSIAWDWIGANWGGVVASCAFVVSVLTLYWRRKHDRLSVRPHIMSQTTHEETPPKLEVRLMNAGLGPALIKKYELAYKGKLLEFHDENGPVNPFRPFLHDIPGEIGYGAVDGIAVLRHEKDVKVVSVNVLERASFANGQPITLSDVRKRIEGFTVKVEYESLYGESFTFNTATDETVW
jgi:hypothetical protein